MTRFYSKRLLLPFVGVIQLAELDWARAMSLDGKHWAVRYLRDEDDEIRNSPFRDDPRVKCSLVVTLEADGHNTRKVNRYLDPEQARIDGARFYTAMREARIPFAAADRYEYWLLDERERRPLALLQTCFDEAEMDWSAPAPAWLAMPAAELPVADSQASDPQLYTQPVNYRLERRVEARAGNHPQAAWFRRSDTQAGDFPALLLREDWEDEEGRRLCELYLRRLAPRLLMLSGLAPERRQWLEQAAREYALDVERFYPLYPDVFDRQLLNAARVEARLRRSAGG